MVSKLNISDKQAINIIINQGGTVTEWVNDMIVTEGELVKISNNGLVGRIERVKRYADGSTLVSYNILASVNLIKHVETLD